VIAHRVEGDKMMEFHDTRKETCLDRKRSVVGSAQLFTTLGGVFMRSTFVFVSGLSLMFGLGCGGTSAGDDGGDITETDPAFVITSSEFVVQPGEEFTKCFYFTMPNTEKAVIHKWVSDLSPGSHHMIMFRTLTGDQPADGTVDDCTQGVSVPIYGTQIQHEEVAFPDDDGFGRPLAQEIQPGTQGYFQMHYFNATDTAVTAHVTVSAYALLPEIAEHVGNYTKVDLFGTYNNDISIPPHAVNLTISATCPVVDANFFQMSSHSHKQSVGTAIKEGTGAMVVESSDWEHPAIERWDSPFYHFDSGNLTWECTYTNLGDNQDRTVRSGQSAATDEMCMAIGYYFPASGPKGCVMDGGQCQCLL